MGFVGKHSRAEAVKIVKVVVDATVVMWQDANNDAGRCYGPTFKVGVPIHVDIYDIYCQGEHILTPPTTEPLKGTKFLYYDPNTSKILPIMETKIADIDSSGMISAETSHYNTVGQKKLKVYRDFGRILSREIILKEFNFPVVPADEVDESQCDQTPPGGFSLCNQIPDSEPDLFERCRKCFAAGGVWTAVGCIPSDPESIIHTIIRIGLMLGGGIVLVMILVGAFMLSVSKGDPKKTQEAKELITSAIVGLLFIIFSVTILQFIGVSVIRIPGFGEL